MNIAQLVSAPTTSGPGVHVLELSKQLRLLGHRVTIVARPGSWIAEQALRLQFDVIQSDQFRVPPTEMMRLGRELRRRKIDVLHTHMSRAHVMGVLLRYWCSLPCVATAHNQKVQLHWPFNNQVIATSRSTQQFQGRWNLVPRSRMQTIYCPLRQSDRPVSYREVQSVRRQFGDRDPFQPRKLIGVVGEISYEKGHSYLIDAFARILRQDPATQLVVVGNNREDYVNKMRVRAQRLGIAHRISWAGYRGDIDRVMAAFDVYVCPSLRESLPLTVLEAMSACRPVVSTGVGGLPEIIKDGETGLVVPIRDPSAIARSVFRVLQDPQLAHRLSNNAKRLTDREFDPEKQTAKIEQLYLRLTQAGTQQDPRRFQRRYLSDRRPHPTFDGAPDWGHPLPPDMKVAG